MKQLACLTLLVGLWVPSAWSAEKEAKPVVAIYDLETVLAESGRPEAAMLDLSLDSTRPLTLFDLTRSLEKAASDERVKAVVLDVDGAQIDFAQLQELRRRLQGVRQAGKDVWIYSEYLANGTALMGSVANHFTLMPHADCSFHGIHAESIYFKGLLDKAGVRAEVIHIGDYKSFGEMFYREGPSDEARQQEESLIDSIFAQLVADVAQARNMDPAQVKAIIDNGSMDAAAMLDAGMVDHLMHRTEFVKKIREVYGDEAVYDRGYELPDLDGPEIEGIMDLFKLMAGKSSSGKMREDFVAVVVLDGDITDESIAPVRSQILKLIDEPKAKALVLRVNSPGGSALASEVLWEAVEQWKSQERPIVVSMGGVAASGGYYVSCGADRIFAEAGTITGSIGVVGMKFVVGDAMEKLGITTHTIQRGKNAGAMSMTRGFSEQEAGLIRESMERVYQVFKQRVTDGRGEALQADLESLAGGRVYSGQQALENGLVDEIGGLHEAIAHATELAGLDKPNARLLPEPASGLEGLLAKPEQDEEIIRAARPAATIDAWMQAFPSRAFSQALPAPVRNAMQRLMSRIEAFDSAQILMLGPDIDLR
ncbi:MAG: signal peptide peptidase SppA [Luteolibacter sp.]